MTGAERLPSSFRDPGGFLFRRDGVLYRQINEASRKDYDRLLESGLYDDLVAAERSGGAGTVAATGATFREIIDFADLDSSLATNAPGQSARPGSPYYGNLTELWAAQEYFPMLFSRAAVEARAEHRLVLRPAG